MLQVRYNMFETNSSSTCTLSVMVCQVDNLDIPPVVKIESNGRMWDRNLNGCYAWAADQNQEEEFFGLLKYVGVKEIYVDGKQVEGDPDNRHIKFTKEPIALAMCFGDFKSFSEWMGHGDEWDNSSYLTKEQIKAIQTLSKDPAYIIICTDEDDNEVSWSSLRYAKMVITDEEIEAEREYLAHKKEWESYEDDYDEPDNRTIEDLKAEDAEWDDDDFYISKKNRHSKKKRRR